jgi:hypothetical protein
MSRSSFDILTGRASATVEKLVSLVEYILFNADVTAARSWLVSHRFWVIH